MATSSKRAIKPPAHALAHRIAQLALEKKAEDILVVDLRGLSSACDFFVICSAGSEPQVKGIVDHIEDALSASTDRPWHVEGRSHRRWVLIDCVDVVVHVFHRETREYYMLERLWADAPREEIKDEPKAAPRARRVASEASTDDSPKAATKTTKSTTKKATGTRAPRSARKSAEE